MPKLAVYPSTRGLSSIGKRGFQHVLYGKISKKTNFFLRGDFRPLPNKNVQIWDHFFPLLFPKDSESLKLLDIRLREVGAKRPLNGTSRSEQTNRQTDHRQTDGRTFRLIESIGPEGRCFENKLQDSTFNGDQHPFLNPQLEPCRVLRAWKSYPYKLSPVQRSRPQDKTCLPTPISLPDTQ